MSIDFRQLQSCHPTFINGELIQCYRLQSPLHCARP
uniref:Uncharacterized protein n=1 Tax=Anguilla anguilla TaxID=7936 RepID=A0A0E9U7G2_ANGAN